MPCCGHKSSVVSILCDPIDGGPLALGLFVTNSREKRQVIINIWNLEGKECCQSPRVVERRAEQRWLQRPVSQGVLLGGRPAQDVGRFPSTISSSLLPACCYFPFPAVIMYLPVSFLMAPHPCPNQVMQPLSSQWQFMIITHVLSKEAPACRWCPLTAIRHSLLLLLLL